MRALDSDASLANRGRVRRTRAHRGERLSELHQGVGERYTQGLDLSTQPTDFVLLLSRKHEVGHFRHLVVPLLPLKAELEAEGWCVDARSGRRRAVAGVSRLTFPEYTGTVLAANHLSPRRLRPLGDQAPEPGRAPALICTGSS